MSTPLLHEDEISKIVANIRAKKAEIKLLEDLIEAERDILKRLLEERGDSWKDAEGYAMLTAESVRTSYDTSALDTMIVADPLQYGWLEKFRKSSLVAASLRIK